MFDTVPVLKENRIKDSRGLIICSPDSLEVTSLELECPVICLDCQLFEGIHLTEVSPFVFFFFLSKLNSLAKSSLT